MDILEIEKEKLKKYVLVHVKKIYKKRIIH